MEQTEVFSYTYRPPVNQEVLNIRRNYLPPEERKRPDPPVQNSGVVGSLCTGIGGCLIFGSGLCLAMQVIGNALLPGILLGLIGTVGMLSAYPVYRKCEARQPELTKRKHFSKLLETMVLYNAPNKYGKR